MLIFDNPKGSRLQRDAIKVAAVIRSCVNTDQLTVANNMLYQFEKKHWLTQDFRNGREEGLLACEELHDIYFEKLWALHDEQEDNFNCTPVAKLD